MHNYAQCIRCLEKPGHSQAPILQASQPAQGLTTTLQTKHPVWKPGNQEVVEALETHWLETVEAVKTL